MSSAPASTATRARVAPSVPIATLVFVVYVVVVVGLMALSGINYADFFDTTDNTLRAGVLPLGAGAVWLIAFLTWARWDHIFRDARRLPMAKFLWTLPIVMLVVIGLELASVDWVEFELTHILAVLAASVLVGFTEETLFRGIILRSLRQGDRSEAAAVGWTTLWFGGFHLINLVLGEPGAVVQVAFAALAGVGFYLARRGTGVLIGGMVLHGGWDFASFLFGVHRVDGGTSNAASFMIPVTYVLAGITLLVVLIRLRRTPAREAITAPQA